MVPCSNKSSVSSSARHLPIRINYRFEKEAAEALWELSDVAHLDIS
jgi:hypothetical protein